jgi:adenylylsulfate kinase
MEDRKENVRRVAEVAKLMNDAGLVVITSFISPLKTDREIAKLIIGENKFREIYVSTPLEVCESRDPKGLYLKAREGLVTEFTGISSPYEAPENPWLSIDTSLIKVDEAIAELMSVIPY